MNNTLNAWRHGFSGRDMDGVRQGRLVLTGIMKRSAAGVLVFALVLGAGNTRAGECTGSDEGYLLMIEQGAGTVSSDMIPTRGEIVHAMNCLIYYRIDVRRWAGPRTATYFAELHRSPVRDRLVAACTRYLVGSSLLGEGSFDLAFEAATTLAMCGVAESGGQDVFEILTRGDSRDLKPSLFFALASLADPRTLPFLRANYDSLSAAGQSRSTSSLKTQIVNCLYHLPGDPVESFVQMIATTDPDSAIVERAKHVLKARHR